MVKCNTCQECYLKGRLHEAKYKSFFPQRFSKDTGKNEKVKLQPKPKRKQVITSSDELEILFFDLYGAVLLQSVQGFVGLVSKVQIVIL